MRFITAAASAGFLASHVLAHPHSNTARKDLKGRAVDLNAFRFTTSSDYSNVGQTRKGDFARMLVRRGDYLEAATNIVKTAVSGTEFRLVDDHYVGTNGVAHVNFKQTVHGLDVDNADFNVNIARDGSILSYGNSFFTGAIPSENPLTRRDQVDPVDALRGAASILSLSIKTESANVRSDSESKSAEHYVIEGTSGAESDPEARLVYIQTPENTLALTWRVETDLYSDWILSYIDASSAKTVYNVVNYVADVSYEVFPWGVNDPVSGTRIVETDPSDSTASEFTWQGDGTTTYTTTRGNNGISGANYEGDSNFINDYRPNATDGAFVFDYSTAWTDPKTYSNSSVTQLFYTANVYHDLLYKLGFTEAAGNFETNNNDQGGKGNDAVVLNAQDGRGLNNANFATPVDGQPGRMSMYIWNAEVPNRDASFDASVIIHEYTHGVSTRLTGGPANSNCLNVHESGGMGEGWGDFMSVAIDLKVNDTRASDKPMGPWVSFKPQGIRAFVYSTSLTTNPLTYDWVNTYNGAAVPNVHSTGTVWATMLYEVLWNLVETYGINEQRFPTFDNGVPTDGRFLTMQLVIDGMALQPCSPTFVQARDAIIDADEALTGGANACLLWTAFAKRGLGSGAARGTGTTGRTENFDIPVGAC